MSVMDADNTPVAYPKPRILMCALGPDLATLYAAGRSFAGTTRYIVDEDNSHDGANDNMSMSFGVCWDTVAREVYDDDDEEAVEEHGAAMYMLTEHLEREQTLAAAITAVDLAVHLLDHGATAVKCESAGVAHGQKRWRTLAAELAGARTDPANTARLARIAVTKRPLGGDEFFESLGNHLVGLPEVYVPLQAVSTDREAVRIMDRIGDELVALGTDRVLAMHGCALDMSSQYEGGFEFKINPYGCLKLPRRFGIRASVAGA
jgi:hypothetical protein